MLGCVKTTGQTLPIEYHLYKLYAEPSEEVLAKVKTEKIDRSQFQEKKNAKKYTEKKEQIKSVAFGNGEGMV